MEGNLPRLTARLALAASFVRRGVPVADIGTDHAYLPVWLVNSGFTPSAVASDVRQGPIDRAKRTVHEFGADDKITFSLADGLDGIEQSQAEDVVIAGMGGELIADIICRCGWLKNPHKHLVLQPMTAQEDLREFLCENGYTIEKEEIASEKHDRKLYLVMSVFYSGEIRKADPLYCTVGELPKASGENVRAYLQNKARALNKKALGISKSKNNIVGEAQKSKSLAEKIMKLSDTVKI